METQPITYADRTDRLKDAIKILTNAVVECKHCKILYTIENGLIVNLNAAVSHKNLKKYIQELGLK